MHERLRDCCCGFCLWDAAVFCFRAAAVSALILLSGCHGFCFRAAAVLFLPYRLLRFLSSDCPDYVLRSWLLGLLNPWVDADLVFGLHVVGWAHALTRHPPASRHHGRLLECGDLGRILTDKR